MSQEYKERNGTRNDWLNKEYLINNLGRVLRHEELHWYESGLCTAVRSDGLIVIIGRDPASVGESLSLLDDHPITIESSGWVHVFKWRGASIDHPLDLNRAIVIWSEII